MTPRISHAIDIFLDAINNGTLAKGDCTACAVGNLVRVGMGLSTDQYNKNNLRSVNLDINNQYHITSFLVNWSILFATPKAGASQIRVSKEEECKILSKYPEVKDQIESTDFTIDELAKIEEVFENSTIISYHNYWIHPKEEIRADQIKGLEAVVKVMLTFDEQTEDVKEVFTHKAELMPI